jgi:hypothetical protein
MLNFERQHPDPVAQTQQIAWIRGFTMQPGFVSKPFDHLLEMRFAGVQDFGPGVEQGVRNLLQLRLAGLATFFECHVQSVLSNP